MAGGPPARSGHSSTAMTVAGWWVPEGCTRAGYTPVPDLYPVLHLGIGHV